MADEDWCDVIDVTYKVVLEQLSRGKAFDKTLSKTLQIGGLYQVGFIIQSSDRYVFPDGQFRKKLKINSDFRIG